MTNSHQNALSEDELVQQARDNLGEDIEAGPRALEEALLAFWGHGFSDESEGTTDFYHVFRVHRWLLYTDSQGFTTISPYDTEAEAIQAMDACREELWSGEEEL